jgi:hypothetical protein
VTALSLYRLYRQTAIAVCMMALSFLAVASAAPQAISDAHSSPQQATPQQPAATEVPPPLPPRKVRQAVSPELAQRTQSPEGLRPDEYSLVRETRYLVIATLFLSLVGAGAAVRQSLDMRGALKVGQQSADAATQSAESANKLAQQSARDHREELVREVNLMSHKVAITATQVDQMAKFLVMANQRLAAATGNVGAAKAVEQEMNELRPRVMQLVDDGVALLKALATDPASLTDEQLVAELHRLDGRLVQAEAAKEEIARKREDYVEERRLFRETQTAMMAAKMMNSGK